MNQREAKRVAARELARVARGHAESPPRTPDGKRIGDAFAELASELARRGRIPLGPPPDPNQIPMFEEDQCSTTSATASETTVASAI